MNIIRLICAFSALTCTSCSFLFAQGPRTDAPGLSDARKIAWESYGRTGPAPVVALIEKAALTCRNSPGTEWTGFGWMGVSDKQKCNEGVTLNPSWVIVAWVGQPWSQTTVCHELRHAAHMVDLIFDPGHTLPDWKAGGLVEQCNAKLAEAGK